MHRDIYATAVLAGATVYLLLTVSILLGMLVVTRLRLAATQWKLRLPRFKLNK